MFSRSKIGQNQCGCPHLFILWFEYQYVCACVPQPIGSYNALRLLHFWKNLYPLRIDNLSKKPEISHISQSASLSWFGRGQHIIFNNLFGETSKYLGAIKLSKETTNYTIKSHLNNQKLVKPIHQILVFTCAGLDFVPAQFLSCLDCKNGFLTLSSEIGSAFLIQMPQIFHTCSQFLSRLDC